MIFSRPEPDPEKNRTGSGFGFGIRMLKLDPDPENFDPGKNHAQDVMSTGSENTETVFSVVDSFLALQ